MAIIEVSYSELKSLLNLDLSLEDLEKYLLNIKCEIDSVEGDKIKIEVKDFYRIDLLSITGIVREIKGILNIETGIPKYNVSSSGKKVLVEETVRNVRPYIACAIVEDVKLNENRLLDLIRFQNGIARSFGSRRRKVAIGTHNLDLIEFPVYYKAVKPEDVKFIPLGENKEMNLNEILERTDAGKEYKSILEGFEKYPILIDSNNKVISFPPIINSNDIGKLDEKTKNIFVDVTGTNLDSVLKALTVITLALADYGGKIKTVEIVYPDKKIVTPDLRIEEKIFDLNKIIKILGFSLSKEEIIDTLKKKRMEAEIIENKLKLKYLNYRFDIISEQDIAEEIIIAYGLHKIEPKPVTIYTKGKISGRRKLINLIRKLMTGLGCIELYTPVLVNSEINKLLSEEEIILLENPVSLNYNSVRASLLSSIFQTLSEHKEIKLPAKLFEVGRIAFLKNNTIYEEDRLIYLYSDNKVSFSDALSVLERIFKELGLKYKIEESHYPFLIDGRQAKIIFENQIVGWIGEINPEILERLEIAYPFSGFEISLSLLKDKIIKYDF
ncbi:MAG: phenylalanine--tRNA ligase subunit beta [Nanopusillaceae archaeon]